MYAKFLILTLTLTSTDACCSQKDSKTISNRKKCSAPPTDTASGILHFIITPQWLEQDKDMTDEWQETTSIGYLALEVCVKEVMTKKYPFIATKFTMAAVDGLSNTTTLGSKLESSFRATSSAKERKKGPTWITHKTSHPKYQLKYTGCNGALKITTDIFADEPRNVTDICVEVTTVKRYVSKVEPVHCDVGGGCLEADHYFVEEITGQDNSLQARFNKTEETCDFYDRCKNYDATITMYFSLEFTTDQTKAINRVEFGYKQRITTSDRDTTTGDRNGLVATDVFYFNDDKRSGHYWVNLHMHLDGAKKITEVFILAQDSPDIDGKKKDFSFTECSKDIGLNKPGFVPYEVPSVQGYNKTTKAYLKHVFLCWKAV